MRYQTRNGMPERFMVVFGILVLHYRALAAGADGTHRWMPAEIGQIQPGGKTAFQQVLARLYLVFHAIYSNGRHQGVPPSQ